MPAKKFTKKANTKAKSRQWQHVYDSQIAAGKSKQVAIMSANAALRDHPTREKK